MRSIRKIRESTRGSFHSEAYAQWLHREGKSANFDTWMEFMSYANNRKKRARALIVINGGLK